MPSGTDLITWSPRVGATGDDRYDPGAVVFRAGDSAGYSSVPTVTEVNAGSGWNQIVAEVRRRNAYSLDPTTYYTRLDDYGSPAYFAAGTTIDYIGFVRSNLTAFASSFPGKIYENAINIRAAELQSAFTFSALPVSSAGTAIKRQQILEARKALATDFIAIFPYRDDFGSPARWGLLRSGAAYPPATTTSLVATNFMGQRKIAGGNYTANRRYIFCRLPTGLPSLASAKLSYYFEQESATSKEFRIYRSNSFLGPIDTGDWGNLDNLEATVSDPGADTAMTTNLASAPSADVTYIFASTDDAAGNTPTDPSDDRDGIYDDDVEPFYAMLKLYT